MTTTIKKLFSSTARIILFIAALMLLLFLNYQVWKKDAKQEQEIVALQKELQIQRQENNKTAMVNKDLKQKIESLKQGSTDMIEEEARSGFGMVGEGETFIHFDDKEN